MNSSIHASIHYCPLCDWRHIEPEVPTNWNYTALDGVFGTGVTFASFNAQRLNKIEQALKQHLNSHSMLQWLTKVKELEQLLIEQSIEHGETIRMLTK